MDQQAETGSCERGKSTLNLDARRLKVIDRFRKVHGVLSIRVCIYR